MGIKVISEWDMGVDMEALTTLAGTKVRGMVVRNLGDKQQEQGKDKELYPLREDYNNLMADICKAS